jgi:hypothetical protein
VHENLQNRQKNPYLSLSRFSTRKAMRLAFNRPCFNAAGADSFYQHSNQREWMLGCMK